MILGCFLGAGFVSGREIAFYFARFDSGWFLSIILTVIFFFLLTMLFFKLSEKTNNFYAFSNMYFGKTSKVISFLISICLLIISGSMVAGTGTLAKQLGLCKFLVIVITLILTFFIVIGNTKSISKINILLVPLLILILLILSKFNFLENSINAKAIISGGNYVFINITTLGMFILEIGENYSKKQKLSIVLCSSIIIGILLFGLTSAIITNNLTFDPMPNLVLANGNIILKGLIQISIYFGLFTTFIANILVLSNYIDKFLKSKVWSILITIFLSVIISLIGFEYIVGYVYLIIGITGMILVFGALVKRKG